MSYNVKTGVYKVYAIDGKSIKYNITNAITGLEISESDGEIAKRVNISVFNVKLADGTYLSSKLALMSYILIYAGTDEVYRGVVWEWELKETTDSECNIVSYDLAIYLQKSKDNSYYSSGKMTADIVKDICKRWNVKVNYNYGSIQHGKLSYKNIAISEHIIRTLDDAKAHFKVPYILNTNKDTICINQRGTNTDVYTFDDTKSLISFTHKTSLNGLITKIQIVAKKEDDERTTVEYEMTGKTQYGYLQEIITRDNNTTLEDAKKEAQALFDEKGSPIEKIVVEAPDIPNMHKGDRFRIKAATGELLLYVVSISHDGVNGTMSIDAEK